MASGSTSCTLIICPWVGVIEHLFLYVSIFISKLFRKKHTNKQKKNKTKENERCAFSQPTGAASLDPDYITVTSLQTSRESVLSFDKFRYLDIPKLDEIMVYDDFECNLMRI